MKTRVRKYCFTLVELLVVCGILMVLMGMGVGVYSFVQRKMLDARCQAMIAKMCIALENYKAKTGYYIQSRSLNSIVGATAFYIDPYDAAQYTLNNEIDIPQSELGNNSYGFGTGSGQIPNRGSWKDPWSMEFRYRCPGTHNPMSFDLYSFGADKLSTTDIATQADDISNWKQ